jgi:PTH1 family peptidyl-tRNA hydrolase
MIVGLGNPGENRADTPHNVGQRALELVAASLGASWTADDEAMVARVDHPGGTCYLVKPLTAVNVTGPALHRLAERLGVGAAACLLLHDDIDLPGGSVRTRMAGGDGGHRGVRSVLDAFQTFAIRRVKIGVGRPASRSDVARHVLTPFDPTEQATLDAACAEAATRAIALSGMAPSRSPGGGTRCLDAGV